MITTIMVEVLSEVGGPKAMLECQLKGDYWKINEVCNTSI